MALPMRIEVRHDDDASVIIPAGKLVLGGPDALLESTVTRLLDEGKKNLVLDLQGITLMDSSGVDALVRSWRVTAERGGAMKCVNAPPRVLHLLTLTGLTGLLGVTAGE